MPSVYLATDSAYVSGTFWTSIGLAILALVAIVVSVVLARRANPRRQITCDTRISRLVSPHAPSDAQIGVTTSGVTFGNPYLLELRIASRSRKDIGSDDFDRQKPLVFAIDAPVAVHIGDSTVAESTELAIDSGIIAFGPCLIRKGTMLFAQFLTEGRPTLRIDSPLKDVKVAQKTVGAETWPGDPDRGPRADQSGVIDFRYHLVSIVAVFLALAIGIVLGATELQVPKSSKANGEGVPCLGLVTTGPLHSPVNATRTGEAEDRSSCHPSAAGIAYGWQPQLAASSISRSPASDHAGTQTPRLDNPTRTLAQHAETVVPIIERPDR